MATPSSPSSPACRQEREGGHWAAGGEIGSPLPPASSPFFFLSPCFGAWPHSRSTPPRKKKLKTERRAKKLTTDFPIFFLKGDELFEQRCQELVPELHLRLLGKRETRGVAISCIKASRPQAPSSPTLQRFRKTLCAEYKKKGGAAGAAPAPLLPSCSHCPSSSLLGFSGLDDEQAAAALPPPGVEGVGHQAARAPHATCQEGRHQSGKRESRGGGGGAISVPCRCWLLCGGGFFLSFFFFF